ncbi:hypothetical protein QTH15_10850 [Clostridium perfringens]|nr:hypothetical protein [Clostridium perfringens]
MAVVKRRTKPIDIFKKMSEEDERKEIQNQEIVEETIEETIEKIEEVIQEQQYNLENFKASKSKQKSVIRSNQGVVTIINTEKNGKRIVFPKDVMEELGNPPKILISCSDNAIAVGERLPDNQNFLSIKYSKTKGTIYSAGTVNELTEMYQLDFRNKTSITFSEVKYTTYENHKVAIITID